MKIVAACVLIVVVILSNGPLYEGQFYGEDETGQMISTYYLGKAITNLSLHDLFFVTAKQYHPPLRYWLSIPGVFIFPKSELGVRIVPILFSFAMIVALFQFGKQIGTPGVGFFSSLIIASSAVFNLSSMAFSHSLIVWMLLLCSMKLTRANFDLKLATERRDYRWIHAFLIICFLTNTGTILFFATTTLLYFVKNPKDFWLQFRVTLPFGAFYVLYYLFFLVAVPHIVEIKTGAVEPLGQLYQNLSRKAFTTLNYASLIDNLKGINAYILPFVSWAMFIAALYSMMKYKWELLLWLSLYTLFWSFVMTNLTHQYFIIVFIVITPFFVKFLFDSLGYKYASAVLLLLSLLVFGWNYTLFIKKYQGENDPLYPKRVQSLMYTSISRQHNIERPYRQLGRDIDQRLKGSNTLFQHNISGAFTSFYFTDSLYSNSRYAGSPDVQQPSQCPCLVPSSADISLIVSEDSVCEGIVRNVINYPNTRIKLYEVETVNLSAQ